MIAPSALTAHTSLAAGAPPPANGFWLPDFHMDLDALALSGLLAGIYFVTIIEARRRGITYPVGAGRVVGFLAGALTLLVASSWPLHDLSEEYLFSVHMVQHMLFIFVAAPLLLWGMPNWLMEVLLEPAPVRRVVGLAAKPLVAFFLFNGGQAITHVPEVTDAILRNHALHYVVHLYIVASALLLWFPVLSAVPGLPRLSYPMQMVYLMLQSAIPTVVYAPLTFSEEVVYSFYGQSAHIWGLNPLNDQRMAGLLMKIGGGFIMWGWIAVIFFKWFNHADAGRLQGDFAPLDELTPRSALRAAEDVLRKSDR